MPETGIGLFPDVGGGWYLPRLHGAHRALDGADRRAARRRPTASCSASPPMSSPRGQVPKREGRDRRASPEAIERILTELRGRSGPPRRSPITATTSTACSPATALEAIVAALEADGVATGRARSWRSMRAEVAAERQGRRSGCCGRRAACPPRRRRPGRRVSRSPRASSCSHDFPEGVRAVIVDKDNAPPGDPATPRRRDRRAWWTRVFAPLPPDEEWTPLPGL